MWAPDRIRRPLSPHLQVRMQDPGGSSTNNSRPVSRWKGRALTPGCQGPELGVMATLPP